MNMVVNSIQVKVGQIRTVSRSHRRRNYGSQLIHFTEVELVDVSFGNAAAKQVLRAVRCCGGVCRDKKRLYMRSKVYYECDSGCKDRSE